MDPTVAEEYLLSQMDNLSNHIKELQKIVELRRTIEKKGGGEQGDGNFCTKFQKHEGKDGDFCQNSDKNENNNGDFEQNIEKSESRDGNNVIETQFPEIKSIDEMKLNFKMEEIESINKCMDTIWRGVFGFTLFVGKCIFFLLLLISLIGLILLTVSFLSAFFVDQDLIDPHLSKFFSGTQFEGHIEKIRTQWQIPLQKKLACFFPNVPIYKSQRTEFWTSLKKWLPKKTQKYLSGCKCAVVGEKRDILNFRTINS